MKRIIIPVLITTFVLACRGIAAAQPTVDVGAIQTAAVQTSQASLHTQPPAADTSQPTETTTPSTFGNYFAWNYIARQESGGLQVEIARFVLADKTAVDQDFTAGGLTTIFDDRPVVGEIIFKITNPTQRIISVYPDQGKVIGGGEQIDLLEFASAAEFGDNFSGEIHPGVTVIGGIWFGFKRTPIEQITSVTIVFNAPHNQNFDSLGPGFKIVLDLNDRQNQPMPDELK